MLAWAGQRRGMDAKRDLLSMFVNGPDENGKPLSDDRLVGHIMTLYASSFSSSVATLIWSVFVLMQPFSGMVLAKSFYRILGTAAGMVLGWLGAWLAAALFRTPALGPPSPGV